jgi:biopolymer transport protein ExbD
MDFSEPPRRQPAENLLPMINVVFLLLIFFLISAELVPPEPFTVAPPAANSEAERAGEWLLHLNAEGELGYRDALGPEALTALAAARDEACAVTDCETIPPVLTLRADAAVPATRLAALLPQIRAAGFAQLELITATP